ncbi:MAG: hypothetical protein ACRD2P_05775 [Terriglobia bacterium]
MSRNKDIRKQIAAHERNIWKHRLKIEAELKKDFPDEVLLNKWRGEVRRDEERIKFLTRRLERRKNAAHKKSPDIT